MCPTFKNEIFAVGDMVRWRDAGGVIERGCGEGPFRVVRVEEVPTECNCNTGARDYSLHVRGCPARESKDVNHSQWVFVETKDGKEKFSGAYFRKVKK